MWTYTIHLPCNVKSKLIFATILEPFLFLGGSLSSIKSIKIFESTVTIQNGLSMTQSVYTIFANVHNQPRLISFASPEVLFLKVLSFHQHMCVINMNNWGVLLTYGGFPGGSVVKNPSANAGDVWDVGLMPGSGRSPREGNGNPLQYSLLENPMDRGAWQATVHGIAKGWTEPLSTHSLVTYG